jgi:histone deacetylase 6
METTENESNGPATAVPNADKRVALAWDARLLAHTHDWPHLERAARLQHAFSLLESEQLVQRCTLIAGRSAVDSELLTVHTREHVDEVVRLTAEVQADPGNRELREPDGPGGVFYSPHSDAAARLACGCVIDAAMAVLAPSSAFSSSFALVRPPGHHAGFDDTPGHRAEGFCFYNSVAVAAGCALATERAQRVCILDWDVHHGNGTQRLFWRDPRVLYISLHRFDADRWYPKTGAPTDVGEGEGAGYTVNIGWPEDGLGNAEYIAAFSLLVLPLVRAFDPSLLLVSAGFDAADGDLQGRMKLTAGGFGAISAALLSLGVPTSFALEGGYSLEATSRCCEAVLRVMLGEPLEHQPRARLSRCCERALRATMQAHEARWPVLRAQLDALVAYCEEAKRVAPTATRASKRRAPAAPGGDAQSSSSASRAKLREQ